MAASPDTPLTWTAPGPGEWALDRSHVNRPATPMMQHVQSVGTVRGTRRVFIELGAPVDALDFKFVNGLVYSRVLPLIRPDTPATKLPPTPVLKVLTRLHPEMRRRRATADRLLEARPWRTVVDDWRAAGGIRDRCDATNLELQDTRLADLSDAEVLAHAQRVLDHAVDMMDLHFWLHGYDLGPIGLLLHACAGWGIPPAEAIPLLEGASPSTGAAEVALRRIRDGIDAAGVSPTTLDDVRAVSPAVAADLDEYLRLRGQLVVSRYDIDGLTLAETPEVLLATVMAARDDSERIAAAAERIEAMTAAVRARVPEAERTLFDQYLTEARAAMDLRDDNGPHTLEWPLGLMRMALSEVGRRMVAAGLAHRPEHAFELEPGELAEALTAGRSPGADELAGRQHWRATVNVDDAPRLLGGPEPKPPLEALPPSLARIAGMVQMVIAEAGIDGVVRTAGLNGFGVGTAPYTGTARVASSPEAALEALEPGDVLVVPCTTPAYNMVLTLAGAVVTAEGGPLSHAAVLARELGIPAVVGAPRALHDIPDGATIEVDPVAGQVRLVG